MTDLSCPARCSCPDDGVPASASSGLTRAEFDALVIELHELRSTYQRELADRLRDARASGSPGDNEDVLAVHEEVSVNAARIARLEELLRSAPIVDREFDGCVSLGCTVRVVVDGGRTAEYMLIGRRSEALRSPRGVVGIAGRKGSPGRSSRDSSCAWSSPADANRALRILDVTPSSLGAQMAALEGDAEAA